MNHESYWENEYSLECYKIDDYEGKTFTLEHSASVVILKAGSGEGANDVYDNGDYVEGDVFGVDVDRDREPLGRNHGQRAFDQRIEVRTARLACRHRVRPQERRHYGQRDALADRADRAQQFQFVVVGQPVAALDLNGRHAFGRERANAR